MLHTTLFTENVHPPTALYLWTLQSLLVQTTETGINKPESKIKPERCHFYISFVFFQKSCMEVPLWNDRQLAHAYLQIFHVTWCNERSGSWSLGYRYDHLWHKVIQTSY